MAGADADMISNVQSDPRGRDEPTDSFSESDACARGETANNDQIAREPGLGQFVEMLFDGILVIRDGAIIETNQGFLSMTGYEASEIVGHKIEKLDGWQDLAGALATER